MLDTFNSLSGIELSRKQQVKSVMEGIDRRARIAATFHARDVQSVTLRMVADSQRERQRIFHDDRITTDVSLFADTTELVHAGIRADVRAILNHDMPCERGRICHNDTIADQTIVRDVRLGHDETVVTKPREHSATRSAPVNCDELANLIAFAAAIWILVKLL